MLSLDEENETDKGDMLSPTTVAITSNTNKSALSTDEAIGFNMLRKPSYIQEMSTTKY
jgi:hypothetical protein